MHNSGLINLQAILFIFLLLGTYFFNQFAADDYYFIGELRTKSFQEIYAHLYFNWHGRWTSNFLLLSILKLHQTPYFLFLYGLTSCAFLYLSIYSLSYSINQFYLLKIKKYSLITYSFIFLSVFFFCTVSPNDSWFWYTSSVVYLWSTSTFFFSLSLFIKKEKSISQLIFYIIALVYIGGSNEPLAILAILALGFFISKKTFTRSAILGIAILSASLGINYFSPGTGLRDSITPSLAFIDLILYTGYGCLKFVCFSFHKTFFPALILAIPFYLLGKKTVGPSINFRPLKQLYLSIGIIALVVFLNQLIVIYALGGLAPDRSSITSSIVIAIVTTRYFFLLGNSHQKRYEKIKYLLIINIVGLSVLIAFLIPIHFNYCQAITKRLQYIGKEAIINGKLIYLDSLPFSGYIYSAEINTKPTHFKNQHLKMGLNIENELAKKTNYPQPVE